jgi:hypothetical protein
MSDKPSDPEPGAIDRDETVEDLDVPDRDADDVRGGAEGDALWDWRKKVDS